MPRHPKRKPPTSPEEPYPDFASPSPAQCLGVRDALLAHHGFPAAFASFRRGEPRQQEHQDSVLDGLVLTLLSQNTTDSNSQRAFANLKSTFSSWDQVVGAAGMELEDAIRCGGLATTKAARIKEILRAVKKKTGKYCLEYLRELSVDEVKAELSQFKGIGPKTIACVLMFYLQQDDFPVDTHVLRITKAIGWIPATATREKAYLHLNKKIPEDLKFDLNCLFVTHGKVCQLCTKKLEDQQKKAASAPCPLASFRCVDEEAKQLLCFCK